MTDCLTVPRDTGPQVRVRRAPLFRGLTGEEVRPGVAERRRTSDGIYTEQGLAQLELLGCSGGNHLAYDIEAANIVGVR